MTRPRRRPALGFVLGLVGLLLIGQPALAQTAQPAPQSTAAQVVAALPRVTTGHAAALGAGMFAGAVAGSALINGGALAALIGAAAGATIGHWFWTERPDLQD